jgi:hypothetical protein
MTDRREKVRIQALAEAAKAARKKGKKGEKTQQNSSGNDALPLDTEAAKVDGQQTAGALGERLAVKVAKENRVPLRKLRKAQKLARRADESPEIKELEAKVRNGEMPLSRAAKEAAETDAKAKPIASFRKKLRTLMPGTNVPIFSAKKLADSVCASFGLISGLGHGLVALDISNRDDLSLSEQQIEDFLDAAALLEEQLKLYTKKLQGLKRDHCTTVETALHSDEGSSASRPN